MTPRARSTGVSGSLLGRRTRWIVGTAQDVLDTRLPDRSADRRCRTARSVAGNKRIGNVVPLHGGICFYQSSIGAPTLPVAGWDQAEPLTQVATETIGKDGARRGRAFQLAGAGGDKVWGQITV